MPNFGPAITDPDLLRQLEGAQPPANLGAAVDPTTAAFLDQLPGNIGAAEVKTGSPSLMTNFLYGMRQPVDQAATMLAKAFPSQAASVAAANQQGQQAYEQEKFPGTAGKVAELAGNYAGTTPIAYAVPGAAAPSLFARLASGAASGATSGALQPVDPGAPDFWTQTGSNALLGAGLGAAVPAALSGVSHLINPAAVARNAPLMNAGITPTIGQALGGAPNILEQAATSVPIAGNFISGARARAVKQFNTGAINEVLAPIGQKLETAEIGHPALIEMTDKVNDAYRKAVPSAGGMLDPQLLGDIANLHKMSRFTPRAAEFEDILKTQILNKVSPTGHISGEAFQDADSTLGKIVRDTVYGRGIPWQDRELGGAVRELQATMRDWLARANPTASEDLGNARAAFARQLRVEHAANMTGGEPGEFSPAQLLSGVKKYTPSETQFTRGEGLMQPYAQAGKKVLGNTLPDSGTATRGMVGAGVVGSLFSHGLPSPETLMAAMGAGIGTAGLYSPFVQSLLTHAVTSRPPVAESIGSAVRGLAPLGSAAAPWLWGSLAPAP